MVPEDHAEDYGLFNPTVRRRGILNKIMQHSKWNPVFYCSALFTIFSVFALIVHSTWTFTFGVVFALLSISCGAVCTYICVAVKYRKPWSNMSKKEMTKVMVFGLLCLTGEGLLVWGHSVLIGIHFNAVDPSWNTFPSSCALPLYCVRVGFNISNPYGADGLSPINPPIYDEVSIERMFALYKDTAKNKMGCRELHADTEAGWAHYRCLTAFMGKRSDLSFQISADNYFITYDEAGNKYSHVAPWIHSQSGDWDDNANDARVRLLISYIYRIYYDNL